MAASDAQVWASFEVPSESWIDEASKKQLVAFLQAHTPDSFKATRKLRGNAKNVTKKLTRTILAGHLRDAIDAAAQAAAPTTAPRSVSPVAPVAEAATAGPPTGRVPPPSRTGARA